MDYPTLFSPMNIGPVTIKNRIIMSSMCVGLAEYDGTAGKTTRFCRPGWNSWTKILVPWA